MSLVTINDVNQRRPRCVQCGCSVDFAWIDDVHTRKALYAQYLDKSPLNIVKSIRDLTGCSLLSAKATVTHLAKKGNCCHRCNYSLPNEIIVDCPNCNSINFNWSIDATKRDKRSLIFILFVFMTLGMVMVYFTYFFEFNFFAGLEKNMEKGQNYLYAMEEHQLLEFIVDANTFRKDTTLYAKGFGAIRDKEVPKRYRKLGIIRIVIHQNYVNYMWAGGFDHTGLGIGIINDSVTSIGAGYNDHSGQRYYPELESVWHDFEYPKMNDVLGNKKINEKRLHYLIDSLEDLWKKRPSH